MQKQQDAESASECTLISTEMCTGFQEAVAVAHERWQADGNREQSSKEPSPISDDFIFVSSAEARDITTGADGREQDTRAGENPAFLPVCVG